MLFSSSISHWLTIYKNKTFYAWIDSDDSLKKCIDYQ